MSKRMRFGGEGSSDTTPTESSILREYEQGNLNSPLEDSEIERFMNMMNPTVVTIVNSATKEHGEIEKMVGGIVVSRLGHILTISTLFDVGYKSRGLKVYFHDDPDLENPELADVVYSKYRSVDIQQASVLVVLKLASDRTNYCHAKLAEDIRRGWDFQFIPAGVVSEAFLRGTILVTNRPLKDIKRSRLMEAEKSQSSLLQTNRKRPNMEVMDLSNIYSTNHFPGAPLFNNRGNIIGLYYFSALRRAFGIPLMALQGISHVWMMEGSSSGRG